jgi:hypothetical protein
MKDFRNQINRFFQEVKLNLSESQVDFIHKKNKIFHVKTVSICVIDNQDNIKNY